MLMPFLIRAVDERLNQSYKAGSVFVCGKTEIYNECVICRAIDMCQIQSVPHSITKYFLMTKLYNINILTVNKWEHRK